MQTSLYRGHKILYRSKVWIYIDTEEKVQDNKDRKCGHCNIDNTVEGHDGCLGALPGLKNACCGHGKENDAYVQYLNGSCVHGKSAMEIIKLLIKV